MDLNLEIKNKNIEEYLKSKKYYNAATKSVFRIGYEEFYNILNLIIKGNVIEDMEEIEDVKYEYEGITKIAYYVDFTEIELTKTKTRIELKVKR